MYDNGFVRQCLCPGPVADGQRFLPDVIARDISETESLVKPDDVAWKIHQFIKAGVSGGNVHAMNSRHSSWYRHARNFTHNKFVMGEKLFVILAVRQVLIA